MALVAWVFMWVADRLYQMPVIWFVGTLLTLVVLVIQVEFLLAALGTSLFFICLSCTSYWSVVRGRDWLDDSGRLSLGGLLGLLVIPIATEVGVILTALFHNWFGFEERGMGLIALGLLALYQVLGWISVITLLSWFAVAPIALWNRRSVPGASDAVA